MRLSRLYLTSAFLLEVDVSGSLNFRVTSSHHIRRDSYTHPTLAIDLHFCFANKALSKVFFVVFTTLLELSRVGFFFRLIVQKILLIPIKH